MTTETKLPPLSELLTIAVDASLAAGREVMDVYRREYTVTEKDDRSPLTEADTRSHQVIARRLEKYTPEIPVLSEEGAHMPWHDRRSWGAYWIVDPLDGTKEFIRQNGEFTVNIALMVAEGTPALGVVYAPALGSLYTGIVGEGAYRYDRVPVGSAGPGSERIMLPQESMIRARPHTVVASRSHMSPETEAFVAERRREHPDLVQISSGSSLKICRVAEGSADEYPRFAPTMEWDTAAGDAVARAAGCEVLQWDAGGPAGGGPAGPLRYNKEDLHNPWFLVRRPSEGDRTVTTGKGRN